MKQIILLFLILSFACKIKGQYFDVNQNGLDQLNQAKIIAKAENKRIFVLIGGNWCSWTKKFIPFYTNDLQLKEEINKYVVVKVNYSKENKNTNFLNAFGNPEKNGFPGVLILDQDGQLIWTQNTAELESGDTYNKEKVLTFLQKYSKKRLSEEIRMYVESKVNEWQQKGEFEKSSEYKTRVNELTRNKKIEEFQIEALSTFKKRYAESINYKDISLGTYDADNETFLLNSKQLGEFVIPVPRSDAPAFKKNFNSIKFQNSDFFIKDDSYVISHLEASLPLNEKKYIFDKKNKTTYSLTKIDYNFEDIQVNIEEDKSIANNTKIQKGTNTIIVGKSDIDTDIPVNSTPKSNTYALIIGNEDYSSNQTGINSEVNVQFAENDAKTFKEYCVKTLGIPEINITLLVNATGSKMLQNLELISKISKANKGNAELVFYYAGHGLPDEQTKEPYLIPVDVSGNDLKYAVKLADVYKKLTENPSNKVTVFIDACFSGGARNESLLALRGVKVKPKENVFGNNLVVFTSSSGDESSASYKDKQHGMFTYFLLKKLQSSKGNCTLKELEEYLKNEISVNSLVINKKQQTPQVIGSPDVEEKWKDWKMR